MKKLFLFLFCLLNASVFSQVYFDYPTSNSSYYIRSDGTAGVPYLLDNEISLYVQTWQNTLTHPDGTNYGWASGQNGTWVLSEVGEFQARGRGWGVPIDEPGASFQWYYTYYIPFYVNPFLTVSISGPTTAPCGTGTWNANVSGGKAPYSYQWYHMWDSGGNPPPPQGGESPSKGSITPDQNIGVWYPVGTNSPTLNLFLCDGNSDLRVDVTDARNTTVSAQYFVAGADNNLALSKNSLNPFEQSELVPDKYTLDQNYPNPFNPTTQINYALKENGFVTIKVYDILGKVVATLVNETKPAGFYTVNFDASRLSSGIYFYTIKANNFFDRKKMIVLK